MTQFDGNDQNEQPDANDELLSALRVAMEATDPPTILSREQAERALEWDRAADELVEITFDSLLTSAGMRSTQTVRDLVFDLGEVTIELTVEDPPDDQPGGPMIEGLIVGADAASLWLLTPTGSPLAISTDDSGRFRLSTQEPLIALRVDRSGGQSIRTPLISTSQ